MTNYQWSRAVSTRYCLSRYLPEYQPDLLLRSDILIHIKVYNTDQTFRFIIGSTCSFIKSHTKCYYNFSRGSLRPASLIRATHRIISVVRSFSHLSFRPHPPYMTVLSVPGCPHDSSGWRLVTHVFNSWYDRSHIFASLTRHLILFLRQRQSFISINNNRSDEEHINSYFGSARKILAHHGQWVKELIS